MQKNLGTIILGAVYPASTTDKVLINKQEYRAKKWSFITLVPLAKLKRMIKKGLNIYELSDYFEVTEEYMQNAIEFYRGKYGVLR